MPAMIHKAGTALATGATATGIDKVYTQSSGRNAAGELEIIRNADGSDLSVYVKDPHKELSFEAVFEASVADKEIGDVINVTSGTGSSATTTKYLVTQWNVTEANDDVKKVSIGLRETTLSAPTTSGGNPS